MRCAIWYHLYHLRNMKNTHGGVLLLIKLTTLLRVTLLHRCFSRFLNCTCSKTIYEKPKVSIQIIKNAKKKKKKNNEQTNTDTLDTYDLSQGD